MEENRSRSDSKPQFDRSDVSSVSDVTLGRTSKAAPAAFRPSHAAPRGPSTVRDARARGGVLRLGPRHRSEPGVAPHGTFASRRWTCAGAFVHRASTRRPVPCRPRRTASRRTRRCAGLRFRRPRRTRCRERRCLARRVSRRASRPRARRIPRRGTRRSSRRPPRRSTRPRRSARLLRATARSG